MSAESWAQAVLLVTGIAFLAVWAYHNVWRGPKVARAVVLEKTWQQAATRLPDVFPGTGGVFNASTTNILVLEVAGKTQRYTANDESWNKVRVGDTLKVWVQNETHVVGVHVLSRGNTNE